MDESHTDFLQVMRHNDVNNITPSPYFMRHFQMFHKIDSFLKNVTNANVTAKKGRLQLCRTA